MKKIILSAFALVTFGFASAQSNEKGTMHLNVMGGFTFGGATDKDQGEGIEDTKYTVGSGDYGVSFQYGLADNFSAGVNLELGTAVFVPKDLTSESSFEAGSPDPTMSTFKFGVGARYYIVNKDRFNFFVGPNVGFLTGKDKTEAFGVSIGDESSNAKFSGLNLGLDAGINFYFNDFIGGIVKLGYDNNMTTGKESFDGVDYEWKRNYGGVKIAAGVAFKF